MPSTAERDIADEAPWSNRVTDYDLSHNSAYLRLLDAAFDGAMRATRTDCCRLLLCEVITRNAGTRIELQPFEVVPRDDVDHTGDRVRAIDR